MAKILNSDRIATYAPNNSAGPFPVAFPLFDNTGADLHVVLNDVPQVGNWTLTSTVDPTAPNTWINCAITFAAPVTGTLVIGGRRAPRRQSEYQEGKGVGARDFNAELSLLTAVDRELDQRIRSVENVGEETLAAASIAVAARQDIQVRHEDVVVRSNYFVANYPNVVTRSNQVAADAVAVAAARNATEQAAATGFYRYPTLAELNTKAPADGAVGEVLNDGGNTGSYRRAGGVWIKRSSVTVVDLENQQAPQAPLDYAWGVMDSAFRVALGVRSDGGTVVAELEAVKQIVGQTTVESHEYPGYVWVLTDSVGKAAVGLAADGTLEIAKAGITDLTVTTLNGVPYSPAGPAAVSRAGGVYSHQINFINNTGQSLGEGSTPAVALTTAQEYDNVGFSARALNPGAFVPLTVANTQVGGRAESPMYGTLGHIKELIREENGLLWQANDYQLVTCNNAYGGFSITQLNKGTDPYARAISQVQAAFNIATTAGKSMAFQAVTWTQGEQDAGTGMDPATYKAHLKQLANDYNNDGKAITGQTQDVKLITYQLGAYAGRAIGLAQLEAANEHPLIVMACPMYQFDYGDTLHITAESAKWLGGYYGLAYKRVVVDRREWHPLQPVGHAVNGATVDLIFNKTGLTLDTALVPTQPNYGFDAVTEGGASIAVNSVQLVGPNRVRLTLASAPAPGARIRYGFSNAVGKGTYVGGCGNLRDNQGDTIVYSAVNKPMHNWCVIFNYMI